jgi:anti-anti-sigma factor
MLSLNIHNLGDVAVLQCKGRITANEGPRLRQAVLSQSPLRVAVIDLAEISAIDAAGVGMLLSLRAWASDTNTALKLMNLTPLVEEVLQVSKLRSAFEICSVAEMIDLLCRASRLHQAQATAGMVAA